MNIKLKIAVIGGIWSLAHTYDREVKKHGHDCLHYNGYCTQLRTGLQRADAIILFTSTVSHQAADMARILSRQCEIPLLCAKGSGISALRRALGLLAGPRNVHTGGAGRGSISAPQRAVA